MCNCFFSSISDAQKGFNLVKALLIKEHGYAIIYAKTALPWSLDCKFLATRLRMTEQ